MSMKSECLPLLESIGAPRDPQKDLLPGEADSCSCYDASGNSYPEDLIFADSMEQIITEKRLETQKRYSEISERRKYLWVVTDDQILIAFEGTPAETDRGFICHSNLTKGGKARVGGELWFLKSKDGEFEIHINFDSGRYGTQDVSVFEQVYKLFGCVGYYRVIPFKS